MAKSKTEAKPSMSQRKMVEAALDALGAEAGPKELMDYIHTTFNANLKSTIISSYKSQIRAKAEGRGGMAGISGTVDLKDMAQVKELLNRLGAPQLQSMIKVLSKM